MKDSPFPHLSISENLVMALQSLHPDDLTRFFDSVRKTRIPIIENCPDSDLTKERGKLTMVSELESTLLTIRNINLNQKPT